MLIRKKQKSLGLVAASTALAGVLALGPTLSASASQELQWGYNCSAYDNFELRSFATQSVAHYRNGAPVASWTNTFLTWRTSYLNKAPANAGIWASLSIADYSTGCVTWA